MKIPKLIRVGGHLFTVIEKEFDGGELGETDFTSGVIAIESRLPQTLKESTLIHEVFHVINPTLDDNVIGHALLDSISEQFYQVLKDNKFID